MSNENLLQRQQQFMDYLLQGDESISRHISEQGEVSVSRRMHIYRHAYQQRLKETIETDHEILGLYLGDDLFDQMAVEYIQSNPSHGCSLRQFCDHLPHFLATTEPFLSHPIIGELAAFERLLLNAFDAAEAERMCAAQFAAIPAQRWPDLSFTFHPSMQVFTAQWNSVEAWQMLKSSQPPQPAQQAPSTWLLWRNRDLVTEFESLATEEHQLLDLALQGQPFSTLCETLLDNHSAVDAGAVAVNYLLAWLNRGLLTTIAVPAR